MATTQSPGPADKSSNEPRRPDPWDALRHEGFLFFLVGAFLSNTGNQMRTTAIGWELYGRTREPWSLGLIGLVLSLPVLTLALPAGVLADRFSRKKLVLWSQVGLAACGFGLAWASAAQAPIACSYALLLGTGVFRALGWPAAVAMITGLVPARSFANAATWRSISFQMSATLGPLTAGWLLAATNPATVYLVDAASSLILIGMLRRVNPAPQARATETRTWHSLLEGARFVRREPLILSVMTLDMVAVLFGGATALLPIYAADVLKVGEQGFGWLRAMPSIGAIVMSVWLAIQPPLRRSGPVLLAAVAAFGVTTIVFGLSKSYSLSLAALFLMGLADNVSVIIRATLVQLLTPDSMRGRVAAINAVFINTSNELGEFESGAVADALKRLATPRLGEAAALNFGAVATVAGGGVMTLLTVAACAAVWPQLLKLGRLDELHPAAEPPPGD
jgi:MFS family permease